MPFETELTHNSYKRYLDFPNIYKAEKAMDILK